MSTKVEESSMTPLISKEKMEEFESYYPIIVNDIININEEDMPDMRITTDWLIEEVLDYNVCGGKKLRGLLVPISYKCLAEEVDSEQLKKAFLLGWISEIFQGASLIADDIMDQSETRRGKVCWYKRKNVGMLAVNDCFLLENLAHRLVKVYCGENVSEYLQLNFHIREVLMKSILGQGLDYLTGKSENIIESFTTERYAAIVKYKTSYYTIYLPIVIGMILAGKHLNKEIMDKIEKISLEIGHYFQAQDDYLDCFGDEKMIGKIGSDIQDNKCTWLFVKAVERCTPGERRSLLNNYGSHDPQKIQIIKNLYKLLKLPELFAEYESEMKSKVFKLAESLPKELDKLFRQIFLKIYQRRK